MNEREQIQNALSPLHASNGTIEEVLKKVEYGKKNTASAVRRIILVVPVIIILLAVTAFAIGKSGLRNWWDQHSKLCTKTRGLQSFEMIMGNMHCDKFLISYSEDGLFTIGQLRECFSKFGTVSTHEVDYNRFKSNNSRLPQRITEYLITVER